MRAVPAIAITFLGACTFGRLDGLTGGEPDRDAGAPTDSGPVSDAADVTASPVVEDAATRTTVLVDGFEEGGDCQGTSFNSTLSRTDQKPHGGKVGCRVCAASAGIDSYSYSFGLPAEAVVGARYQARVWFRMPTSGASGTSVSFALRSVRRDPYTIVESEVAFADLRADWGSADVDFTLTKPAEGVDFYLSQTSGEGYCFVLDDLEITRVR